MALSDCEKCWDTPCTCGWEYRKYTAKATLDLVMSAIQYKPKEEQLQVLEAAIILVNKKNNNAIHKEN